MRARILTIVFMVFINTLLLSQSIELKYSGKINYVGKAVEEANRVLKNQQFYNDIEKLKRIDSTNISAKELANEMRNANLTIELQEYKRFFIANIFNCVNAYTPSEKLIRINTACFSNNLKTAVNTLIHETVHAVDYKNEMSYFTHWKNNNKDHSQDYTAPWLIGEIAENYIN